MLSLHILIALSQEQEPHGEETKLRTRSQILRFEKPHFQGENGEDLVGWLYLRKFQTLAFSSV